MPSGTMTQAMSRYEGKEAQVLSSVPGLACGLIDEDGLEEAMRAFPKKGLRIRVDRPVDNFANVGMVIEGAGVFDYLMTQSAKISKIFKADAVIAIREISSHYGCLSMDEICSSGQEIADKMARPISFYFGDNEIHFVPKDMIQ